MAVTPGDGFSLVTNHAKWYDLRSFWKYHKDQHINIVKITGSTTTDGAVAEINFAVGDTINYIAAEGQAYIRTELDDQATQGNKYVYLQYQDDTGAILDWVTSDLDNTNTTTEVAIGSTDFYRARQMYCEVEATATKGVVLTDANMGGVDDIYAFINDANSQFNLERFFIQPSATCDSYLASIKARSASTAVDATLDSYLLDVVFTPRVNSQGAEDQVKADKTLHYEFNENLEVEPLILLEPATEVIFKVGDNNDPGIVCLEAMLIEVYPIAAGTA
jgi:hypothetical protein